MKIRMGFVSNSSSSSTIIAVLPSDVEAWKIRMERSKRNSYGDTDYDEKTPAAIIEELARQQAEGWGDSIIKETEKLKEVIVDVSNAGYSLFKCGFGSHGGMLHDDFPEIPFYPEHGGELGISPILCLDHQSE